MDSRTLLRCGMIWLVLLLFAIDGASLIRAQDNVLAAEQELVEQPPQPPQSPATAEPLPWPVTEDPPTWFVDDLAYSDVSGILDIRTGRSCMDLKQAQRNLWRAGAAAIGPILDRWYGSGAADQINLDPQYVRDHLIHDNLVAFQKVPKQEPILDDVDSCYVGYARLELDQEFREYAKTRLKESRTRQRILGTGLLGGTVLSILIVALGYLKLEAATRGFYSRRLQTIALLLAIAVVAAAAILFQSLG